MSELYGSDAYAPREVAQRIETVGVAKARLATFVAAGFEHSIANMFFFPLAMLVQATEAAPAVPPVTWGGMLGNLLTVIAGNLLGGSVLVGLTYHVIDRRGQPRCSRKGRAECCSDASLTRFIGSIVEKTAADRGQSA